MGYAVYLDRLSFQKVDATGMPEGDPEIVTRGQQVPDYVRPFELHALRSAGAIVDMGSDAEEDDTPRFAELPPALPNPEIPPTLAGGPVLHSLDAGPEGLEAREGVSVPVGSGDAEQARLEQAEQDREQGEPFIAPSKPTPRDSKAAWEDYAETVGMDRGEAESMNKQELIAAVEAREAASA
jgi:hypothetical protein